MTDNIIELNCRKKESCQGTHQVTPITKMTLPKRYSGVKNAKPVEENSSNSYNNLMLMMHCSMQRQFMDQEEHAE